MRKHRSAMAGSGVVLAFLSVSAFGQVTYRTVAGPGETAPGTGNSLRQFGAPDLNPAGDVAFIASSGDTRGVWKTAGGDLVLVARAGIEAPGATWLYEPVLNEEGAVAFSGHGSSGVFGFDISLWVHAGGATQLIARTGGQAPGTKGAVYRSISESVILNEGGDLLFSSYLQPGVGDANDGQSNNQGLWAFSSGQVRLLAREATTPTNDPALEFSGFVPSALSPAGVAAWIGNERSVGTGIPRGSSIYISNVSGGQPTLVTAWHSFAPDIPRRRFELLGRPQINGAGQIAFIAILEPPLGGGLDVADWGIWATAAGKLTVVARTNDDAPGTKSVFRFVQEPVLNALGDMAFAANVRIGGDVDATNNDGIWATSGWPSGTLALIAREGTVAPGASGALFDTFGEDGFGPHIVLNAVGDLAFLATLRSGKMIDEAHDGGLWAYSKARDQLFLIAREGDAFDVDDDPENEDIRVIADVKFRGDSGLEDGRAAGLNNAGQIAFSLDFTDGTGGVFIATLPPPCAGDFDRDGDADHFDLMAFLDAWHAGDPSADLNGDGRFTGRDVSAFVHSWTEGCP